MWQVLLAAAAAAGSGILAQKLISPIHTEKSTSDCDRNALECLQNKSPAPHDPILHLDDAFRDNSRQEKRETLSDDGKIFRFSCPEAGSREFRKSARNVFEKNSGSKRGNKNGQKEIGNGSGKKISICLKKRRTGKHSGKCESCASKDNTFGWGVGFGIMYMMSGGNAEITKLNSAMDETVKTVRELKAEISRRKSSLNMNVPVAENDDETKRSYNGPLFADLSSKSKDNIETFGSGLTEDGEYASSIITVDQQQPEVLEMRRLEVELESELQKLPWVATEGSGSEGRTGIFEAEDLAKEGPWGYFENSSSYRHNGVLPTELDQKLCHLLIEQQESQIVELEAELHHAHSKLHQKEAELRALKDRVKRLTEFSLLNASDDENEEQEEEEDVKTLTDMIEEKLELEATRSTVGMKRTLGYGEASYICSGK